MKVKKCFRASCGETITTHLYTLPLAVAVPLQSTSHRRYLKHLVDRSRKNSSISQTTQLTYRALAIDIITEKHQNIVRPLSMDFRGLITSVWQKSGTPVGSTVIFETQAHWNFQMFVLSHLPKSSLKSSTLSLANSLEP